ncbi:hypothetical protein ACA910_007926 [Epithemia clementina (nom. ined.)]
MKRRSSNQTESPDNGRRRRSTRAALRKYQEIDHVRVEETFGLQEPVSRGSKRAGEACYVAATINNRRYYGTLVDQDALKTASLLYFQDTASGLEINQRMKIMGQRQGTKQFSKSPSAPEPVQNSIATSGSSAAKTHSGSTLTQNRVQKFRFVEGTNGKNSDYSTLLATYASVEAAAEDDEERLKAIDAACQAGGDFVGKYYYQYEVRASSLLPDQHSMTATSTATRGLKMSMGFHAFLQNTFFPEWYPLSNLEVGQQQILGTRGIKKDNSGMLVWDEARRIGQTKVDDLDATELIPMDLRSSNSYKVVVVGGGIAGLSCCLELFQLCDRDGVDIEVVLVEGRARLGGRLWTDRESFKTDDIGTPFPVDLGASWIHGIDSNPLAAMAIEAKVDFILTSEEVTMLREGGKNVDKAGDERAGELFDKLLDMAVETCWRDADGTEQNIGGRAAVRWYASKFVPTHDYTDGRLGCRIEGVELNRTPVGRHRDSSDTSVDEAMGKVIASGRLDDMAALSEDERRMLFWNTKNIEYALGANISDLSMKYWDIDERHAFEGDHVILKQGYSCVVEHIYKQLEKRGERFTCLLGTPCARIEYARKTTSSPYFCHRQGQKRFVDLSDTCRVLLEKGEPGIPCDFVVCAVPLGVLKDSIDVNSSGSTKLVFEPQLPFCKIDAIESVGFGLLDKVYLQFPGAKSAFWRTVLKEGQTLFGNASSCNPHHYMFIDIGLSLDGRQNDSPAVLMTLISGAEAAASECLAEEELVAEVMLTLRTLFHGQQIPEPVSFKVTRWGRDRFSRGSYTYLAPGTTDQDFRVLQSPINGNGDSILLDNLETMRLFFAGEHTTSLHPSMAHGAMLSGYRAAQEIVEAMSVAMSEDSSIDRTIPLAIFRKMNPNANLSCSLCHMSGSRVREGSLLAFKRGSREALAHSNCAENSPEVGVKDGVWTNVIRACNRGKMIECSLCGQVGATIGCSVESCPVSYHFSCAEDTGWRFDEDGKDFSCYSHRPMINANRKISLEFWLLDGDKGSSLSCNLCGVSNSREAGELLAFQNGKRRVIVHEFCARFTSTVKLVENTSSRFDNDFTNIFEAVDSARSCGRCSRNGATVECHEPTCANCYHFKCARSLDWDFASDRHFHCIFHRSSGVSRPRVDPTHNERFQHSLFSVLGAAPSSLSSQNDLAIGSDNITTTGNEGDIMDEKSAADTLVPAVAASINHLKTAKLSVYEGDTTTNTRLVNAIRESPKHKWNLTLDASINPISGLRVLSVAARNGEGQVDGLCPGDRITTINGVKVGTSALDTVDSVLKILSHEVEVLMEVCDGPGIVDDAWQT